ncbi:hypothetical protein [Fulvimarina sp. MAC8]|uniref:hypothetical protein n=1 Tax=Fulvimarina sp. MAC8 TaxID=3162874 RepID=UPI0032EB2EC2
MSGTPPNSHHTRQKPMPDGCERIKTDHDKHRELLGTIGNTEGANETRQEDWHEFYYDVKSDAAADEEDIFTKAREVLSSSEAQTFA